MALYHGLDIKVGNLEKDINCHIDIYKAIFCEDHREKGLYETLQEIRKIMDGRLPVDGIIDSINGFRTHLNILPTCEFMSMTSKGENVEQDMEALSKEYMDLKKIEDQGEYMDKAIDIFARFLQIHPYIDGNGRTARALLDIMFVNRDIVPPVLYDTYYDRGILDTKVMGYLTGTNRESLREYIKGQTANIQKDRNPMKGGVKEKHTEMIRD